MIHPTNDCPDPSFYVLRTWDREVEAKVASAISLPVTWRAQVMAHLRKSDRPADTIFEEIGIRRNEVVRVSPRPQYLELVTLAMLEGLGTGGGYCGRGERT